MIWVVIGLLLLLIMLTGWRRKVRTSLKLVPTLPEVPVHRGADLLPPVPVTYVVTTQAGDWLQRVAAHGLGNRAAANVTVSSWGVVIERIGEPDIAIAAEDIVSIDIVSGMVGKYMGKEAMPCITWQLNGVILDTGVLPDHSADRQRLVDAINSLISTAQPTQEAS